MVKFTNFKHPYALNPKFKKKAAYFSMEFAIDQPLKIYSGGLGFLAGSHMRSVYDLKQGVIGIGMLWKYGYYDQVRKPNQEMDVLFQEKINNFLVDTGIQFQIEVNGFPVHVKAWYLHPDTFGTAPMFFLSTDVEENDYLAKTITHRLYDFNTETRIAQYMTLGLGGGKLLDILNYNADVYHLNEAHALAVAFHMYKETGNLVEVKKKLVFTTHTPEAGGNDKHNFILMHRMGFFNGLPLADVRKLVDIHDDTFDYTLVALRMARLANGVSKMHGDVANDMWKDYSGICKITSITNAQNKLYWHDAALERALETKNDEALWARKLEMKKQLFATVADQSGKIFDPKVLTVVWARRFAEYKRADLITKDIERFEALISNTKMPVQFIWAGKPFPMDYGAIDTFNGLVQLCKKYSNCAVLTGYELQLSRLLKQGADVWLNNPRITREASGTSGMTAAMNAAVNFSTWDGWIPEFTKHGVNGFIVPEIDYQLPKNQQDRLDMNSLFDVMENEIVPTYYKKPSAWLKIIKNGMKDVAPMFDSDRMATEYYEIMYK